MKVDKIVIGGPENSMVRHGAGKNRGYGAERKVIFEEGEGAEVISANTSYHLTEPTKMTLCERSLVASVLVGIVKECKEHWPDAEVFYIGTFPSFVEKCCTRKDHMTGDDAQVINSCRKDMDKEIVSKLIGERVEISFIDWFELMGMSGEPTLKDIVDKKLISSDNVHLTVDSNRNAAVYLCRRMLLRESEEMLIRASPIS